MTSPRITASTVAALVADAARAPSLHNTQPWAFRHRVDEQVLELRGDPGRALPVADPALRALHLACGAALFNLRVAAANAGYRPVVRALPDPADPLLLAEVALTAGAEDAEGDGPPWLYPAIRLRRSSREPFEERPVPEEDRRALRDAARREGARLEFPDPWHSRLVLELADEAEELAHDDRRLRAETARWLRPAGDRPGVVDGVRADAVGPRRHDGRAPVRDFGERDRRGRPAADFERSPQLALVTTDGDRPADWLRAGQAMERVLLEAAARGLATGLSSAALERPELRWAVSDPRAPGRVQMVLRLGYGPGGPATPRRPVSEILREV